MDANQSLTPNAVVFDLGEVLASPRDLFSRLAETAGASEDTLENAYWAFRDDHDRGGSADTFWSSVLTQVSVSPSPALVSQLTAMDAMAWVNIRPDALEVFSVLAGQTVPVSILSNAPVELAAVARRQEWAKYVDEWFFSGELRVAKPDPRIYDIVAESLSVAPPGILFFDDRQVNVDAALKAGWNARLWTSGADTKNVLSSLSLI
jgi:putative hydrolase of the HAD superfamily